jgi:hypothetical protein
MPVYLVEWSITFAPLLIPPGHDISPAERFADSESETVEPVLRAESLIIYVID